MRVVNFMRGALGVVITLVICSFFLGDCARDEYRAWRRVASESSCGDGGAQ